MRKSVAFFSLAFFVFTLSQGAKAATLFRLPLASNPGYYSWYDHNPTGGATKKYDCTAGTPYDGHNGTDFATSSGTNVYAAATGSLYYRIDGCPDGSNPSCGSYYGNHVRISHADGRVSIYAHFKNGTVVYPQSILCGGLVGKSGNSGKSTAPHLHFEMWQNTAIGSRIDFFGGSCSNGGTSYWVNQNNGYPTTTCQ